MSQELRDYQLAALASVREEILRGKRSVLLVAPTGSGKTTIAAAMIESATRKGNGVLFIAHRKELIDQCSARLDQHGVNHGVVMADHRRWLPWLPVQVASIQTLLKRRDKYRPKAQIVVIDEAHHARADSYHTAIEMFPGSVVLGLTATPWRIDGRGLGDLFQSLIVAATPHDLIRRGYLVPYTGYAFDSPDLTGVKRIGGDFKQSELEAVMGERKLLGNIVEQWQAHAGGVRTVVFAVDVKHSKELCDRFKVVGVKAEHLDATTPKQEREAILSRLASGATAVVCNVAVLTEGWDCPAVECIVLARPTDSLSLHLQMVGRGLRPNPETGKVLCRIHDHAGNIIRHGLPDADRDYALDLDRKTARKNDEEEAVKLRTCEMCFAIYLANLPACPTCGHANAKHQRERPKEDADAVAVPLEEIAKHGPAKRAWVPERAARTYYDSLLATAAQKGYKQSWAAFRFKDRYGFFPRSSWR
jgi:superfamily II DNA or RNA helicase